MEGLSIAKKDDGNLWQLSRRHGKMTEYKGRSLCRTESSQKLTDGLSVARKENRISRKFSRPHGLLMEVHLNAWKFDGGACDRTEC